MTPYLKQVVRKYYADGRMEHTCFIFPNRRAGLFFRKYLAETIAADGSAKPVAVPQLLTINDFFYGIADARLTDRVSLLLELYDCYKSLNDRAESLDEFIFWGDIILADFNDVDKYLAKPQALFTNVSDFKRMQDSFSYLSETQRRAIESFVRHFNDRSGRMTVDIASDKQDVKARFLQIWNILYTLYELFNAKLKSKGLAYEGMVYREVADSLQNMPVSDMLKGRFGQTERFVFVGLNALNECEKALMRKMRDAGLAEFCWDYSGEMIADTHNKSSFFMAKNVLEFPQAHIWDEEGVKLPNINVIAVPSGVGQVKMVPDIIREHEDCAVVLPDEHLLMPLLNTIPPEIDDINVTMGYNMLSSSLYGLMSDICNLQLHTRERKGEYSFYHKNVSDIFSNGIFKTIAGEEGAQIINSVKEAARIFVPESAFRGHWLTELIFRPVIKDMKVASAAQIEEFAFYQKEILAGMAPKMKHFASLFVETEFAKAYYNGINRLIANKLEVLPLTYIRLLDRILGSVSVPFKGEPLKGLQIMGPLETRALDFRNLILLSANEGVFPKRSVSSSFIPAELRKGFGLPTYEYQDAIRAYYFYRMICRAENVWMIYDSRTEGVKSGEESRYIKQLQYHFRLPVRRFVAGSGVGAGELEGVIPKTEEDVTLLKSKYLSASSLQTYMACPAKFYYQKVKGLRPEGEVAESLDAAMLGTVYHSVMERLYSREGEARPQIDREYLRACMDRREEIRQMTQNLICEQLKDTELGGRNIVTADVITEYVMKTLERDMELLEKQGLPHFEILGLERSYSGSLGGFMFTGVVDRLDRLAEGQLRVCDYKTGKVYDEDIVRDDKGAAKTIAKLFSEQEKDRDEMPKIALQFFIYNMLLRQNGMTELMYNSVYSTAKLFTSPIEIVGVNESFYTGMTEKLEGLLAEMADVNVPFARKGTEKACSYCDFKTICGK